MAEMQQYRHPMTNRVRWSDNPTYMERTGFEPYDGEVEKDKVTGHMSALSEDMTKTELQKHAEDRGLSASGTKDELRARIAAFDAAPTDSTSSDAGDE